jgi:hypothetical protein
MSQPGSPNKPGPRSSGYLLFVTSLYVLLGAPYGALFSLLICAYASLAIGTAICDFRLERSIDILLF